MQYRPGLLDGFLASTGLDLTPFSLGYSHQGQEFSDHAGELRKHPKSSQGASTFWVRVKSSVSAGHPWCTVKIVTNRGQ